MTNLNKFYLPFLVVAVAVVLIVAVFLKNAGVTQTTQKPSNQPKPSSNVEEAKNAIQLKNELTKTDKKTGELTLEDNEKFRIDYMIQQDQFMVIIKKSPFAENKAQAEQWFKNKGFGQTSLCVLKVYFTAFREVTDVGTAPEVVVPTGCPAPKL